MTIRKTLIGLAAIAALSIGGSLAAAAPAQAAYYGGWYYDNNPGGWDIVQLGNGDGSYLHLVGTEVSCGAKGASYARIHQVLSNANNSSGYITWWIANTCDGSYDRICVQNDWGQQACSAFEIDGWYDWYNGDD
jgi:hypothetical protein